MSKHIHSCEACHVMAENLRIYGNAFIEIRTSTVLYNIMVASITVLVVVVMVSVGYDFIAKLRNPEWKYKNAVTRVLGKGRNVDAKK